MRVFLDSCVILSTLPREIFLEIARQKIFELWYSSSVESETKHVANRKELTADIEAAFISFKLHAQRVDGGKDNAIWLPDENDRHVLLGAIAAKADILLTENLRDFPIAALKPFGIEALSPDQFIARNWLECEEVVRGFISEDVTATSLKRAKLYKTAKLLRD